MTVLFVLILLVGSVLAHFLPRWTRPDVFFAVTVDPSFRQTGAGRRILSSYRGILWGFTIAGIALFLATGFLELALIQIAGFVFSLAVAHHQALAHAVSPSPILEVDLAAPRETLPGGLLVASLPIASLVALALWASSNWDRLPSRIPVHWGLHGADRWVARTTVGVYGLIAMDAVISLGFVLFAWGILHWSRRVSTTEARAMGDRRFRRLNVQLALLISYVPAAQAWIVLLKPEAMGLWWSAVLLLPIAVYFTRLIRARQSLITVPVGDRTPDTSWKLGIFYFNPADPSIFVEKRFGIGYTFNFGNRWSWAVLGALMMAIFARALLR